MMKMEQLPKCFLDTQAVQRHGERAFQGVTDFAGKAFLVRNEASPLS